MHMLCIRHGDGPEDDRVAQWCARTGIAADTRRPYRGAPAGQVTADTAGVVVFGGMYNAYASDTHPFLRDEYRLIETALAAGTPLLGICQGAQMIAHVLGAWVGPPDSGMHEFGYYRVSPTADGASILPAPLHLAQAHFHTFDLPRGATHLARSDLFENQAFAYGPACLGFQFHAEVTEAGFRRWQDSGGSYGKPGAQNRAEQTRLMQAHAAAQAAWFDGVLDAFFAQPEPS